MFSQRVLHSDNGTLLDLSASLKDFYAESSGLAIVASEDKLYLGSEFPFNHRYFNIDVANSNASVASVEIWDGTEWKSCVDVYDGTSVGGKTLAQSGIISWWVDKDDSWQRDDTNYSSQTITGLSSVTIYDLYWVRITFSANLSATTALKYVGQKFSNLDDLRGEYPDLVRPDVMQSFETGKVDWLEQEIRAAELIAEKLKSQGIIFSKDQILSYEDFKSASIHKVAELIYSAFSEPGDEKRIKAHGYFNAAMDKKIFKIDENGNGKLDPVEKVQNQGWLSR
jgi:hypothetical protein